MKFMIAFPYEIDCAKIKKALAPIARPRARFSYDDLFSYLIVMMQLLQPGAYA
jgi:hypothetical protein